MPSDLADALPPQSADPSSAGQLAEGALYLLNPDNPTGPDYVGAARMCLLAVEVADPHVEGKLRHACLRVAARSALRSGDRETYIQAVGSWEEEASRNERASGELAIHRAIRDRLLGTPGRRGPRVPASLARLLPPEAEEAK